MNDMALWWPDLAAGTGVRDSRTGGIDHAERVRYLTDLQQGGTVFTLTRGEQLLLWSARRWRHGRFRWDQVEMEFRRMLPGGWQDALIAWEEALELLHQYPTGRPDIGNGCRSALSTDERALLTLVAVLQRGPRARVSAAWLLSHLIASARQRDLAAALLGLAATLSLAGTELPLRACPVPVIDHLKAVSG
ncbi:hypothetical protein CHU95_04230 [Niveispirillum lacus]|uniref:Uncharacterized protein n=1 Tax=Niveispirillum lacus TaxID=1981099 RepID=A0A255Z699_9PROT|nr:hypothetical protein [Niveispirillum lacus]OYQ36444.1 hypothetical protein CHU95_04230 [Niveispirillum lacus]